MNGYTFPTKEKTTKQHLVELLAIAQEHGWTDIAAATDNLLDLMTAKAAKVQAAEIANDTAWLDEAIADAADWADEMATRESVRPY